MGYIFEKSSGTNKLEDQSEFLRCSLPTPCVGQTFLRRAASAGCPRPSPTLSYLFRPHPDELLICRLKPVRADELSQRPLDLGPGLRLFGIAEPDHELAQGQRSPHVLHGLSEGGKAPPSRHRVDGYLPKASRAVGVLEHAGSTQPKLAEALWRRRRKAAHAQHDRVRDGDMGASVKGRKHHRCEPATRLENAPNLGQGLVVIGNQHEAVP